MNINKNNSVIRDHYLMMDAQGECDKEPTKKEIEEFLMVKGWIPSKIKVDYDKWIKKWRWECKLI